jgi:hypothetical protein
MSRYHYSAAKIRNSREVKTMKHAVIAAVFLALSLCLGSFSHTTAAHAENTSIGGITHSMECQ